MELRCHVQQYSWGKRGRNSEVAMLASSSDPDLVVNETMPYAELWMGTHTNGPSILKGTSQKLSEWIAAHENCLGVKVLAKFGRQLPFLFKVLSVENALSIQAHPSKEHAEELHRLRPDIYKDPNHKPEMAIALTVFEALCGFRPINEIKQNIQMIPELQEVIGKEAVSELMNSDEVGLQGALKSCFTNLMHCPKLIVETQLQALLTRMETLDESSTVNLQSLLLQQLYTDFPGDVGCFAIYFLNYIILSPGESIYLGPNEPHAYLGGDCIECMACSDNVVRVGLTPKYRDVDTLCNMLSYNTEPAIAKKFQGLQQDDFTMLYQPPVPDFAVAQIMIPPGITNHTLIPRDSASIIIVINGEATSNIIKLKRGTVLFLPADEICTVTNGETQSLSLYQAFANTDIC